MLDKWHGLPVEEATWKHHHDINAHFQHFHHEENVNLFGAGNVMDFVANSSDDACLVDASAQLLSSRTIRKCKKNTIRHNDVISRRMIIGMQVVIQFLMKEGDLLQ